MAENNRMVGLWRFSHRAAGNDTKSVEGITIAKTCHPDQRGR